MEPTIPVLGLLLLTGGAIYVACDVLAIDPRFIGSEFRGSRGGWLGFALGVTVLLSTDMWALVAIAFIGPPMVEILYRR